MASKRPTAMGVASISVAECGNGVAGTSFTVLPLPYKGSVAFNFSDPKEVKIETEGSDEPLYVTLVKDSTDFIEFAIPTPDNETIKLLKGGVINNGGGSKDIWEEPTTAPSICKTVKIETLPHNKTKVIYTIINGRIDAKLSEAPGAEKAELLLVKVYKQAAITSTGEVKTAFTREVVTVA